MNIIVPQDHLEEICHHHHIRKLALFGSVLRSDFSPTSDIDVLVEFEPEAVITYFELVDAQDDLTALFGRAVDLVTAGALSPYFKQSVLDSARVLYERT